MRLCVLFRLVINARILKFQVKLKETTEAALLFRPHVVVTVDSKGFSFRLLKQLRGKNALPLLELKSKCFWVLLKL